MANVQLRPLPQMEAPNIALIQEAFQQGLLTGDDLVRRATVKPALDKFEKGAAADALSQLEILPAQRQQQLEAGELANELRGLQIEEAQQKIDFLKQGGGGMMTAADAKSRKEAILKLPHLQNVNRGITRLDAALSDLKDNKLLDSGSMAQYIHRVFGTKDGQELDAAVGQIRNSMLALTRVPGIGQQSDLEVRLAALQYPDLSKEPEVNARTLAELKLFVDDLQAAYDNFLTQGGDPAEIERAIAEVEGQGSAPAGPVTASQIPENWRETFPVVTSPDQIESVSGWFQFQNDAGEWKRGYNPKAIKTKPTASKTPSAPAAPAPPVDAKTFDAWAKTPVGGQYIGLDGQTRIKQPFTGTFPALPSLK